jgi:hypothetical protein
MQELSVAEVAEETAKGNADLIFTVGEEVELEGGTYRVKSFGIKTLLLEGDIEIFPSVGKAVKVKGADFMIKSCGAKYLVLKGLPGNRIRG